MKLRTVMVPITNIGSQLSLPIILFGYFLSIGPLITVGIVLFSLSVLFQLVTLPVEFNASRRAVKTLEQAYLLSEDELKGVKKGAAGGGDDLSGGNLYGALVFAADYFSLRQEKQPVSAVKNARLTALKALLRVEEENGYSNLVLDHGLSQSGLDSRDAAFASALFYGGA